MIVKANIMVRKARKIQSANIIVINVQYLKNFISILNVKIHINYYKIKRKRLFLLKYRFKYLFKKVNNSL